MQKRVIAAYTYNGGMNFIFDTAINPHLFDCDSCASCCRVINERDGKMPARMDMLLSNGSAPIRWIGCYEMNFFVAVR